MNGQEFSEIELKRHVCDPRIAASPATRTLSIAGSRTAFLAGRRQSVFALTILQRHGGRRAVWPILRPAFVQAQPASIRQDVQQHLHMTFAPRLTLTVLRSGFKPTAAPEASSSLAEGARPSRDWVRRDQETMLGIHLVRRRRSVKTVATEQLVDWIVRQGRRVEIQQVRERSAAHRSTLAATPTPPDGWEVLSRTVPRIVRRVAVAPVIDEGSGGDGRRGAPSGPIPAEDQQPPPQPINVAVLTDQVIQAIDQRIVAQRERLGRV